MSSSSSWYSGLLTLPSLPEAVKTLKKKAFGSTPSAPLLASFNWTAQETLKEWTVAAIERSQVFRDFAKSPDVGSEDLLNAVPPFRMFGPVGDIVETMKLARELRSRHVLDGKILKMGSEMMRKSRDLLQGGVEIEFKNFSETGDFTLRLEHKLAQESLTYTSHPPDQFLEVIATQGEESFHYERAGNASGMTLRIERQDTGATPLYRLYSQQANLQITCELRNGPDAVTHTAPDEADTAPETDWEVIDSPTDAFLGQQTPKEAELDTEVWWTRPVDEDSP